MNPSAYFNDQPFIPPMPVERYPEPFRDIPLPEQYHSFASFHHSPMFRERHFTPTKDYSFH